MSLLLSYHRDVDSVEDVIEDIREAHADMQELSDALAQPLGSATYDDADLEDELHALLGEEPDTDAPQTAQSCTQPHACPVMLSPSSLPLDDSLSASLNLHIDSPTFCSHDAGVCLI